MLFQPHVSAPELPKLIDATITMGTEKAWSRLLNSNRRRVQANPLLADYVRNRFAIECAMDRAVCEVQKSAGWPSGALSADSYYGLVAFSAALNQVHQRLSPVAKKTLEGRLRGLLSSKEGVASLAFELIVITDLMHRGWDVTCNDLEQGRGFDFLVTANGLEIEVECKTFSADLGRKVHEVDVLELAWRLHENLLSAARQSRVLLVDVRVPDRLKPSSLSNIAVCVSEAIKTGANGGHDELCSVSVHPFAFSDVPSAILGRPSRDEVRSFLEKRFALGNSQYYTVVFPPDGLAAVCVRSARADKVSDSIFDNFKEAAERQLSTKRPAIVWGHVLDLTPNELRELTIATNTATTPTPLGQRLNNFFASDERKHVHSLRLSAIGNIEQIGEHSKLERGPVSIWWNALHPLASDTRMRSFIQAAPI